MDSENAVASRVGFTSEEFKIEVQGLPKFFGVNQAKKLFTKKLKLNIHKIKPCGVRATYLFVNFRNEVDREKAISVLNGFKYKNCTFKAFKAKPAKDPFVRKDENNEDNVVDERPIAERIRSAVCPLADKNYDDQLSEKKAKIKNLLVKMRKEYCNNNPLIRRRLNNNEITFAELRDFVRSPILNGYRNKCEFTIGRHPETNEVTVGFRLASYKKGNISVVGIDENIPIVSETMRKVVKEFEEFVKTSGYEPFDNVSQKGYWKQLTVRMTRQGDLLLWAILHPQSMTDTEKTDLKDKLVEYFKEGKDVTSLHIQFLVPRSKGDSDPPIEKLSGSDVITETLFDLRFSISPSSFFQINSLGAELLYSTIGNIAGIDSETNVIDVCCGTGTIGLCLAKRCAKVYGIELLEEAVKDARKNAERNGIKNVEFSAGRAEHLLGSVFQKLDKEGRRTVAIVDPPRAGLPAKAIHAVRRSSIRTLVYISCDANAAMQNFVSLGKPTSNTYCGDPFVPKVVIPVDLFPHTRHFELIILFERVSLEKNHDGFDNEKISQDEKIEGEDKTNKDQNGDGDKMSQDETEKTNKDQNEMSQDETEKTNKDQNEMSQDETEVGKTNKVKNADDDKMSQEETEEDKTNKVKNDDDDDEKMSQDETEGDKEEAKDQNSDDISH